MKRADWKPSGRRSPRRGVLGAGRRGRRRAPAHGGRRDPLSRPRVRADASVRHVAGREPGGRARERRARRAAVGGAGRRGGRRRVRHRPRDRREQQHAGAPIAARWRPRVPSRRSGARISSSRSWSSTALRASCSVHRRPGGDRSSARSAPGAGVRDACLRRCRRGARPAARGRDRSRFGRRPLGRRGHGERRLEPGGGRAGGGGGSPGLLCRLSLAGLRLRRARAAGDRRRRHVLRGSVLRRARARLRRAGIAARERVPPPLPLGVTSPTARSTWTCG